MKIKSQLNDLLDSIKEIENMSEETAESILEGLKDHLNDLDYYKCDNCNRLGDWGREDLPLCPACQEKHDGEELAESRASELAGEWYAGGGEYLNRRMS